MPLYLVRHGETDWNREKRFQSITDVPLNANGLAQARALRAELARRDVAFRTARCSPLSRAVDTARIVLEGSATPLIVEPAFIEVSLGSFEGQLEADLRGRMGEDYARWRAMEYTIAAPDGESILDGAARVHAALFALREDAAEGNVLIVAHQAVNMAMKVALSGCTDVASAATFRQNNDEVDVWDMARGARLEMFRIQWEPRAPDAAQGLRG
jgi:phosphoserine phosphatase